MTSWTSLPTEEAFITLRALGRVALTWSLYGESSGHVLITWDVSSGHVLITWDVSAGASTGRLVIGLLSPGLLGQSVLLGNVIFFDPITDSLPT